MGEVIIAVLVAVGFGISSGLLAYKLMVKFNWPRAPETPEIAVPSSYTRPTAYRGDFAENFGHHYTVRVHELSDGGGHFVGVEVAPSSSSPHIHSDIVGRATGYCTTSENLAEKITTLMVSAKMKASQK